MKTPLSVIVTLAAGLTVPLLIPTHSVAAPLPTTPLPQKASLVQTKHADVDGDGRSDTVRIYKVGMKDEHVIWKVKVTTAKGKVSSVTYTSPGFAPDAPWEGWAKLDGSKGAEVLLNGYTDDFYTYTVLNWRSGKLRVEKSPAHPGTTTHSRYWSAASETDAGGFRFYESAGHRYVNVWFADCPESPDANTGTCTVKTKRSVWKNGAWKTVKTLATTKVSAREIHARAPLGALVVHK
ncbi:MAG: hypothetical protein LWW77_12570 [Propionibacteriales bacterium]|nr:hypothetical protein [Propionibacteriales bacterium]